MPITFRYDPAQQILFTTAEGVISFADIETHIDRESAAKALGYRELVDASAASTNLTEAEVKQLVRRLHALQMSGPFGPTAIVTTNDTVFGMARMFGIWLEVSAGPSIGVFRTFKEAMDWLMIIRP